MQGPFERATSLIRKLRNKKEELPKKALSPKEKIQRMVPQTVDRDFTIREFGTLDPQLQESIIADIYDKKEISLWNEEKLFTRLKFLVDQAKKLMEMSDTPSDVTPKSKPTKEELEMRIANTFAKKEQEKITKRIELEETAQKIADEVIAQQEKDGTVH